MNPEYRVYSELRKGYIPEDQTIKQVSLLCNGRVIWHAHDRDEDVTAAVKIELYAGIKTEEIEDDQIGEKLYVGDKVRMHQFLFDGCGEAENEVCGIIGFNGITFTLTKIKSEWMEKESYLSDEEDFGIPIGDFYGVHENSWQKIGNIHNKSEPTEAPE